MDQWVGARSTTVWLIPWTQLKESKPDPCSCGNKLICVQTSCFIQQNTLRKKCVLIFLSILASWPGATYTHCWALVSGGWEPYGGVRLNCNVRQKYPAEAVVHLVLKGKPYSKHYLISRSDKKYPDPSFRGMIECIYSEKRGHCVAYSQRKQRLHIIIPVFTEEQVGSASFIRVFEKEWLYLSWQCTPFF